MGLGVVEGMIREQLVRISNVPDGPATAGMMLIRFATLWWAVLVGFGALTGIAMTTSKDFTFMGGILRWIGVSALLLIVGSVVFGFQLGMLFSFAMVVFAGATILYSTSKILRTYPEDRYVSAALELFASVALMFWYILRIFSRR